jgi:mono/diheme cytochrome c family protein
MLCGTAEADPVAGKELAARWCAECHAIEGKGPSPNRAAPRFVELAANPAITEYSLRHLLRAPHATMPLIKLDDDQMEDVVSYVLSLKPRP